MAEGILTDLESFCILLELALERLAAAFMWLCIDLPAWGILKVEDGLETLYNAAGSLAGGAQQGKNDSNVH